MDLLQSDSSSLDWSKLPEDLRYLAKPATLFGVHSTSPERHQMIQEMSDADLIALASLSKVMRKRAEAERISTWLAQYPTTNHAEACLVHHLVELIDEFIREI